MQPSVALCVSSKSRIRKGHQTAKYGLLMTANSAILLLIKSMQDVKPIKNFKVSLFYFLAQMFITRLYVQVLSFAWCETPDMFTE